MPAYYNAIFYFACKVFHPIRPYSMLFYFGLVFQDETEIYKGYAFFSMP